MASNLRTGGRVLIDQLVRHGVDTAFCVPGESYLAALDAFYDVRESIDLITCRHEAGAANMAEAYGKLTGKPGICFVTRGPGAAHALVGLHTAYQDSSPLILFVGQIARDMSEREAFQEMDFRRLFSECSKWSAQIDDPARIPELVSQAFHRATSGRPGPVVLALPEDMLVEETGVGDAPAYAVVRPAPRPADMARLREMLAAAERPMLILGGSTWSAAGIDDIARFARANGLPVVCAFRNQDRFDNHDPHYVGELGIAPNPKLLARIKASDLLLVVGPRIGEMTSQGYTLLDIPKPQIPMVHVHAGADELGRVYRADLMINAGMDEFAAAAAALEPVDGTRWAGEVTAGRADYEANLVIERSVGAIDMAHVIDVLRKRLPRDAIIANDAGNSAGWAHRYLPFSCFPSQLGPTSGAMGYGVPAALAAAKVFPERVTIGFAGDGAFLMTGVEIATALQYDLKPIILLINNGSYGTIRMHQEREYPDRVISTDLVNPDFKAFAASFGAHAECVSEDAEFEPALERSIAAGRCAVIEIRQDVDAITTRATLTSIREAARKRRDG